MSHSRPEPDAARYKRAELQQYENGFRQECAHESSVLLDRFSRIFDAVPTGAQGSERMAAVLEGAADALGALLTTTMVLVEISARPVAMVPARGA